VATITGIRTLAHTDSDIEETAKAFDFAVGKVADNT
jgi:hypothetical protein